MEPRTMAVVGASPREDSFGLWTLRNAANPEFSGTVYAVNPGYGEIDGHACFPTLAEIPEPVDHAVIAVANERLEQTVREAIEAGTGAATIFASGYVEGDTEPKLLKRVSDMAREADLKICGGNCMGVVNRMSGMRATWAMVEKWPEPGAASLITHSGVAFLTLQFVDPRLTYNMVVSAGQEMTVTAADYIDYALEQPSTRVVMLFLETVRDPEGFCAALAKAQARGIPVVAIKVGRTEKSARLAQSHSGALAGNDAAYEAVFDHYGVLRTESFDELTATAQLLSMDRPLAAGGLAGTMDSGGARGMLIDLAAHENVPFAQIDASTTERLAGLLEYGLEPVNPTDCWGTGKEWDKVFGGCLKALADDPDTAIAVMFSDLGMTDSISDEIFNIAQKVREATDKPVAICQHWSRMMRPEMLEFATTGDIPVFDGSDTFLKALRLAMDHRDRQLVEPAEDFHRVGRDRKDKFRQLLETGEPLDEDEGLAMVATFGMGAPQRRVAYDREEAVRFAGDIGGKVVMKTAQRGILHKSDVGGVILGVEGAAAVADAYDDLAARLGPRVLIAAMAPKGVELAAGIVQDPQFGPLVMIAAGGVLIEVMEDRIFLKPPYGMEDVERALGRLKISRLFAGVRGQPPVCMKALTFRLTALSRIAETYGDLIAELDVNPLIAGPDDTMAVDAVVVPRAKTP
jgi:acyl-CoA synthetase (NDP forming)